MSNDTGRNSITSGEALRVTTHDIIDATLSANKVLIELAALRRQIAVLEHDKRGLQDALVELAPDRADAIMNDIRATRPKGNEATDGHA